MNWSLSCIGSGTQKNMSAHENAPSRDHEDKFGRISVLGKFDMISINIHST